jgi:hypothetical protein
VTSLGGDELINILTAPENTTVSTAPLSPAQPQTSGRSTSQVQKPSNTQTLPTERPVISSA